MDKEKTKANRIYWGVLLSVFIAILNTGCYNTPDGTITVRNDIINLGHAYVGDSICATLYFRNNTPLPVKMTFIPECDCTSISDDSIIIGKRKRFKIKVKVPVKAPGEFYNHVYAQSVGNDDFITVTISGFGVLRNKKRVMLSRRHHFGR